MLIREILLVLLMPLLLVLFYISYTRGASSS